MSSVDDEPSTVAVAFDRHLVPFAVVKRQGVDGDQALSAAEIEPIPERLSEDKIDGKKLKSLTGFQEVVKD